MFRFIDLDALEGPLSQEEEEANARHTRHLEAITSARANMARPAGWRLGWGPINADGQSYQDDEQELVGIWGTISNEGSVTWTLHYASDGVQAGTASYTSPEDAAQAAEDW